MDLRDMSDYGDLGFIERKNRFLPSDTAKFMSKWSEGALKPILRKGFGDFVSWGRIKTCGTEGCFCKRY